MGSQAFRDPASLTADLIAPCGMNCGLCIAHLREHKPCAGCLGPDVHKPKHCLTCRIKNCPELSVSGQTYCGACAAYPCLRLRQLDKRYRAKYHLSLIDNLSRLRAGGMEAFLAAEQARWRCPDCGSVLCVHRDRCLCCNQPWYSQTESETGQAQAR